MILYDYQNVLVSTIYEKLRQNRKVLAQLSTGGGKCLAVNTPILMYDGTIKKVQDVIIGDKLMGDDSKARNILSTTKGFETMYRITPIKGDSFTVNESHILSLKVTGVEKGLKYNGKKYFKGDVIDISVIDYLKQNKTFKHCAKQYRVGVDFEVKNKLPIDPYYLGLWLAEGRSTQQQITTGSKVIEDYLINYYPTIGLKGRVIQEKGNCVSVFGIGMKKTGCGGLPINKIFKDLNLYSNKHIPHIYKTSSREDRILLLSGFLDGDGHRHHNGFDVVVKQEKLLDDIIFICRSLGLSAYKTKCIKTIKSIGFSGTYYRTNINGDLSDFKCKLEHHKNIIRNQKKDVLVTGFKIEKLKEDSYYGFEIDGNRRFLLGDFTVTHNTVVFSHIIKEADKGSRRVLVLVHRQELVEQTMKSLVKMGVTSEMVLSKTRRLKNRSNCVIAMVETAYNRLEKDKSFFANIDLVIADEAHIQVFDKVFDFFPNSKILGFTATPVILSRQTFFRCQICRVEYQENTECCGGETMEYTRPNSLSQKYDDIAVGIGIDKLIERGNLVKEISLVKKSVDTSKLEIDGTGEFTEKSQNHAFGAKASISSLVDDYVQFCEGKKTMIFTGSTKVNKLLLKAFEGRNVKLLDTVNSTDKRTEVVDWFKSERDAIIISTGILTAGFDCTDVEAIMLYRATQSLALYIQITGRGARTTKKIYKDNFLFIDYGDNIERFGEFSDPNRDWQNIFFHGIGQERAKREVLESVDQCIECGSLYPASFPACPHCGTIQPPKKAVEKKGGKYVIKPISKMPYPSGNKILEYTKEMGKDAKFAFKVLSNQVLDLFRFYMVDKDLYSKARATGEVEKKVKKMVTPCYFVFIKSDLTGGNRRLGSILNLILKKLDDYYKN